MADDLDLEHEIFCVLRAQSGSHEALNELFQLLQEPLFRYLKNLVREEFKAEDILQEVFIRIYRKLRWLKSRERCVRGRFKSPRAKHSDI
jgi:DNA-directed RNA polymerase specialized sigma24 family protein